MNVIIGQNQRIMHHMNDLSNPIHATKQVVTDVVFPAAVEVVKRRKNRVERVALKFTKVTLSCMLSFGKNTIMVGATKDLC